MEKVHYSTRGKNPKEKAGLFSSIFFWWTYFVIKKGNSSRYEVENLPSPLQTDLSQKLGSKLEEQWKNVTNRSNTQMGKKPNLFILLIRTFWKEFIQILFLHGVNDLLIGIGKQILFGLFLAELRDIGKNENSSLRLLTIGMLSVIFYGINNLIQVHFLSQSFHLGNRIQIALTSVIYRKCLRLRSNGGEKTTAGMVVNLLSNDMRQFEKIIMYMNYSWSGLCSLIIILVMLSQYIGVYPVIASLLCILSVMLIQIYISNSLACNRIHTAHASDKRIQMMDEIICGIQIIKMYAWEKSFEKIIGKLRGIELNLIRTSILLPVLQWTCTLSFWISSTYVLIVSYALLGGDILPETVFVLIGFCIILANTVCDLSFRSFGEMSQCYVSVKRIQLFLELEEFSRLETATNRGKSGIVHLSKVKANWTADSDQDTLRDLNLIVKPGELTVVVGPVGSGKTSLLNVMLGELPISAGNIDINGSVSYYNQVPWIFAGTIRQNILFSQDLEQSRYDRVLQVCALETDFKSFPHGDQSLIGERGITLSGGQKARISLARTIYQRADIYLLDDPLSAVDADTGKKIFEECILDFLTDKTKILVTHQTQFLRASDKVVLLNEGRIDYVGRHEDIKKSKVSQLPTLRQTHEDKVEENQNKHLAAKTEEQELGEEEETLQSKKQELEAEDNERSTYQALAKYILNGIGVKGCLVVLLLSTICIMSIKFCELWITIWAQHTVSVQTNPNHRNEDWWIIPSSMSALKYFIIVYTALSASAIIFDLIRNCVFAFSGFHCDKKIHDMSFSGVMYTHSAFFHNNPSGRILNRFSKDLGEVDVPLPLFLLVAIASSLRAIAAFLISALVKPVYLIPAVIVSITLCRLRKFYVNTSVTLKRLENITKSPVFVHIHATMQGLSTIRSHGAADKLMEQFDRYQDTHTAAWYLYTLTGLAYSCWLEMLCLLYMIAVVFGCFFLKITESEAGLALLQVTILIDFIKWALLHITEVSNKEISIDRLLKYSSLPAERQPEKDYHIADNWPSEGKINFCNVNLRYNVNSATSIHQVFFTVQPMEKVGIVGRTGAGKSSLLAALLRLAHVEGRIRIDDVDTSTVHLSRLRSSISVIPQDPVLFSGTIRTNLDPFDEYEDAALWNSLEKVELKNTISKEEAGLDTKVSQGGKNFSVGQRQLICLARAVLRNNKILVLDEATANVDQQTDTIIQKAIREKFRSCTVLTIAHRLNTVVDSDKILVMDGGTVVEFDQPFKLLQNQNGYFNDLILKTGHTMAAKIASVAQKNYERKNHT